MVKRALTLLTSILFALPLLMPFNIYGATWGDAPIIGVNITMINYDYERVPSSLTVNLDTDQTRWQCVSSHSTMGCQAWISQNTSGTVQSALDGNINVTSQNFNYLLYEYEIVFDKPYVGWIQTDWSASQTGVTSKVIYVNGKSAKFSSPVFNTTFSVTNYSLTYAPEEVINAIRQFDIPFESYSAVLYSLERYKCIDYFNYSYISYPRFELVNGRVLFNGWFRNQSVNFIVLVFDDRIRRDNFDSYWQFSNNTLDSITEIIQWNGTFKAFSIKFTGSSSFTSLTYIGSINTYYVPIYLNYDSNNNISTDFALRFGLTNQLLDDLHLIANGTTGSQSAAQSSDSANSQLQTDSNTLFQQENGFKSDMNNAMQNVNTTFRLQDMGIKFVSSAQWVRTQFEMLTNNTPFASLITFSLITGLALILLGKVYR